MAGTVAIGVQDFSKIIENNSFYIDKTHFIKDWWESRDDVTLITRPRRFGKTLTMSMLEYFFSIRHARNLFFLNNLAVITTTSRAYETAFGFTEQEVIQSLEEYGLQDQMQEIKYWYDGFRFGACDNIYNPWSIINYIKFKEFKLYWANTSSNRLVEKLIQRASAGIKSNMEDLINRIPLKTVLDEQMVFNQLDDNENAVWSFLLAGGYLKVRAVNGREYILDIVNEEVCQMFEGMITGWFAICSSDYNGFVKALLVNDIDSMNAYMDRVALSTISSFDSGNHPSETAQPERFYHGLILGLIIDLRNRYTITSNRESGFGRCDVLLEPSGSADEGMILEFKVFDPKKEKSLQDTVRKALCQIMEKRYAETLETKGVSKEKIRIYGFAFRGKEVLIGGGYISELSPADISACQCSI